MVKHLSICCMCVPWFSNSTRHTPAVGLLVSGINCSDKRPHWLRLLERRSKSSPTILIFSIFLGEVKNIEIFALQSKSLYISHAKSNFYETEIEIWAGFGLVGSTEMIADYEQLFEAGFFMFSEAKKIVKFLKIFS